MELTKNTKLLILIAILFSYIFTINYIVPNAMIKPLLSPENPTAVRSISEMYTEPGSTITISLIVSPTDEDTIYLIEDTVPEELTITNTEASIVDQNVRILLAENLIPPGADIENTVWTYDVIIPQDASGTYTFTGIYWFDTLEEETTILGDSQIIIGEPVHYECINNACTEVPGMGDNICSTDQDCIGVNCNDNDQDNYFENTETCPGTDCDDDDPLINPSAEEYCENSVDDDCDSFIDLEDDDCVETILGDIETGQDNEGTETQLTQMISNNWIILLVVMIVLVSTAVIIFLYLHFHKKHIVHSKPDTHESISKLKEYIQKAMDKGQTEEQIKNTLKTIGWKEEQIDKALKLIK